VDTETPFAGGNVNFSSADPTLSDRHPAPTLAQLFALRAERQADEVAVVTDDASVSFART